MDKNLNKEIIDKISNFKLPKYDEIPDVGLFLEQITKYINKYTEPLENITVTSSMISNYVKKKIIEKPIKKQYFTEQIAYLIFIGVAKTVISLEEISILIDMQKKSYDLRIAYDYFCDEFKKILLDVYGIEKYPKPHEDDLTEEKLLLRNK